MVLIPLLLNFQGFISLSIVESDGCSGFDRDSEFPLVFIVKIENPLPVVFKLGWDTS
jgi:hypothetical protein